MNEAGNTRYQDAWSKVPMSNESVKWRSIIIHNAYAMLATHSYDRRALNGGECFLNDLIVLPPASSPPHSSPPLLL